jgi:hypothetical protein
MFAPFVLQAAHKSSCLLATQQHKLRQNSQHNSITPGAKAQSLVTGQVR